MLAPGAPGPSRPWQSSAPDLLPLREKVAQSIALYPASAIREDIMATPDHPPQSPSPPPFIDVTTAGRPYSSLHAEHRGDPTRTSESHSQDDIV